MESVEPQRIFYCQFVAVWIRKSVVMQQRHIDEDEYILLKILCRRQFYERLK